MFSRPKILFLVSLLFVALLNPKFNPYLLFKFLIFYHSSMVDMHDHKKRRRVLHVNMLKEFQIHRVTESSYFVTDSGGDDEDEDLLFWLDGTPEDKPLIGQELTSGQVEQLHQILSEFSQVLQGLAEHKIDTGTARPVRLPPTGCPKLIVVQFRGRYKKC